MWEIWVEWKNGNVEHIDDAENSIEAEYIVQEYSIAYGESARRIWRRQS